jgi:putative SOS response-associated peptidase YedK
MCQRYVVPDQVAAEREFVPAQAWWRFTPKFNVSATQYVPAIRLHERQSEGVMLRWGLIPSWFEGQPGGPAKTSVQHESIESSKIYRMPWLGSQRCILPLAGYYTWQLTRERYRQPFFVSLIFREVFGVAALWDRWVSEDDDVIESCSIICVPANELMADLTGGGGGMPAVLARKDYAQWLKGTPGEARSLLEPYDSRWMQAYPVSPRINSSDVDDPALIRMAS